MSLTSKLSAILAVLFLFLLPVSISRVGASSEEMATLAIAHAEETVASAYEAVLRAQHATADVSDLLNQLNVAGDYLAKAHTFFRLGDFDGAVHSANLSSEIGAVVNSEAEKLRINAYQSWITSLLIRVTVSIVGIIVVILGVFITWRIFKRRYLKQVQK